MAALRIGECHPRTRAECCNDLSAPLGTLAAKSLTGLYVAMAGAVGAPARFLVDRWVRGRRNGPVPFGTLLVNLTGALVLGLLTGLIDDGHISGRIASVVGTGLLGAYTTFSTITFESVRLAEEHDWAALGIYLVATLFGGVALAAAGLTMGHIIGDLFL